MRRSAWLLVVVAITLGGRTAAQSRPDFSGTWSAPDSVLTIKQDAVTLTVSEGTDTRIYNLDGSERTDRVGKSQLTAQARWVGSALVIATTTDSPIGKWQDLQVFSLDYGPKLSVVQVGAQMTQGMMYTTTKTYGKK